MDFGLTDEQILFQGEFEKAMRQAVPMARLRPAAVVQVFPFDIWQAMAATGVPGLVVPEEYGGLGLSLLDAVLLAEIMGRCAVPAPFLGPCIIAPFALKLAGDPAQQSAALPKIATGTLRIAFGPATVASGSRDGAPFVERGNRLYGRAAFVVDALGADRFLLADRSGKLWLVDHDAPGLQVTPLETVDGTRSVALLDLDGVQAEPLLQATPETVALLVSAARLVLAGDALGAAGHMLEEAVAYAKVREQFGRPIGSFQAVKHMCADMASELEPGRALLWYAAHVWGQSFDDGALAALHAKALIGDAARLVARTSTEVHGGIGITDALGLHFWFKRIAFDAQAFGTPERLREEAAIVQGLIAPAECAVGCFT